MRAWVAICAVAVAVGCGKSDQSSERDSEGAAASSRPAAEPRGLSPAELQAAREKLVARLNESYEDAGTARLDGESLVIESTQCRDPELAEKVVDLAGKAAARVEISDIRCQAPPLPSKEDIVARFNERFADVKAHASVEDDGKTLLLVTDECGAQNKAGVVLQSAVAPAREAGFDKVSCLQDGGTRYDMATRPAVGPRP